MVVLVAVMKAWKQGDNQQEVQVLRGLLVTHKLTSAMGTSLILTTKPAAR
jgi:hypothetical protein